MDLLVTLIVIVFIPVIVFLLQEIKGALTRQEKLQNRMISELQRVSVEIERLNETLEERRR